MSTPGVMCGGCAIDLSPASTEFLGVDIAIGPDPMRGTLIVDHYGFAQMLPNATLVTDYPEDKCFSMLYELLGSNPNTN